MTAEEKPRKKWKGRENVMKNSNQLNVPQAREAMDKFKMQAAQEMGVNIRITSGPAIEKPGDLAALLTNLNENDILFVDEIHRLNRSVEEILYPAMEDFAIDIVIGKGASARSIRLDLPHFTLLILRTLSQSSA